MEFGMPTVLGQTGRASRFCTAATFAAYAGAAPIEVAGADKARHRLSRSGDRQLNWALRIIALIQIRMTTSLGRTYDERKISEGKTHNEAMRWLKRDLRSVLHRNRQPPSPPRRPNELPRARVCDRRASTVWEVLHAAGIEPAPRRARLTRLLTDRSRHALAVHVALVQDATSFR